ncbi:hypothetical protein [Deinococcus yunweiensis]|uniref:hypothetical protein n=1 Tax=Deinococcus yunweiensis TaxID=367282 RepID=UPI00398F4395
MSPRQDRSGLPPPPQNAPSALAETLVLMRGAVVAPPLSRGLVLLLSWRQFLEQATFPGAQNLALDLADLATLLQVGPMDEVPFQLALIGAQLSRTLPHLPADAQPVLLEVADHLARLAQTGAGPRPTP